ncbi:MAG: hypothetical protein ACRET5_01845 [Steroidobacteraceae bacterium]
MADVQAGHGRAQQQLSHDGVIVESHADTERRFDDLHMSPVVVLDPIAVDVPPDRAAIRVGNPVAGEVS